MESTAPGGGDPAPLESVKRPSSILAGPYGHPVHPMLIPLPIGAWLASVVFDAVALANADKEPVFAEGAYWLIGLGILGALVAAVFGLLDLLTIPRDTRAFRVGINHMTLNLAVVALFAVGFVVRAAQGYQEANAVGFVLSLVALALLGASGWLGGKLAYRYGVRVAGESTQAEGLRED